MNDSNSFVQDISNTNCGWNISCNGNIVQFNPYDGDLDCYEIESCEFSYCYCPLNNLLMEIIHNFVFVSYDFENCEAVTHCQDGTLEIQYGNIFYIEREHRVPVYYQDLDKWGYYPRCYEYEFCSINGIDYLINIVEVDVYNCIGPPVPKNPSIKEENKLEINAELIKNSRIEDLSISIYPSPITDVLTIKINGNEYNNLKIIFFNSLGMQVSLSQLDTESEYGFQFNTEVLNSGLYHILIFNNSDQIHCKSFIKI